MTLPDWAKVINENTGIYCDGSCETQINRLRKALEIALKFLNDHKTIEFGYLDHKPALWTVKIVDDVINQISEIGEKK